MEMHCPNTPFGEGFVAQLQGLPLGSVLAARSYHLRSHPSLDSLPPVTTLCFKGPFCIGKPA